MDADDIYADLPEDTHSNYIAKIETENATLKNRIEILEKNHSSLQRLMKEIQEEKINLVRDNEILKTNISSIYLTAKAEIKRKDVRIEDYRKQIANRKHCLSNYNDPSSRGMSHGDYNGKKKYENRLEESNLTISDNRNHEIESLRSKHRSSGEESLRITESSHDRNLDRNRYRNREIHRRKHREESYRSKSNERRNRRYGRDNERAWSQDNRAQVNDDCRESRERDFQLMKDIEPENREEYRSRDEHFRMSGHDISSEYHSEKSDHHKVRDDQIRSDQQKHRQSEFQLMKAIKPANKGEYKSRDQFRISGYNKSSAYHSENSDRHKFMDNRIDNDQRKSRESDFQLMKDNESENTEVCRSRDDHLRLNGLNRSSEYHSGNSDKVRDDRIRNNQRKSRESYFQLIKDIEPKNRKDYRSMDDELRLNGHNKSLEYHSENSKRSKVKDDRVKIFGHDKFNENERFAPKDYSQINRASNEDKLADNREQHKKYCSRTIDIKKQLNEIVNVDKNHSYPGVPINNVVSKRPLSNDLYEKKWYNKQICHFTPMKLIHKELLNFPFRMCDTVSPLANTPDHIRGRLQELSTVKINPVPLINEHRVLKDDPKSREFVVTPLDDKVNSTSNTEIPKQVAVYSLSSLKSDEDLIEEKEEGEIETDAMDITEHDNVSSETTKCNDIIPSFHTALKEEMTDMSSAIEESPVKIIVTCDIETIQAVFSKKKRRRLIV